MAVSASLFRRSKATRSAFVAFAAFMVFSAISSVARSSLAEGSRGSGGAVGARIGWPCPGCVTVVPPSYSPDAPTPLFVALHGDEGSTRVVLKVWKASVEKRGYILLALLCPKEKGCAGSYWRWAGDPTFMDPALDAVEAAYNVDRSRVYLSGWSGGSTYMGLEAPSLSPRFAALNLNAGGIPPEGTSECAPCKAPVYYFMGGRNPFAHLAQATRDYYKRCGHDVEWDFAKDLDHPGELLALSKATRQEKILAWFDDKRNQCASTAATADAGAPPALTDAGSGAPPPELNANTGGAHPPPSEPPPAASARSGGQVQGAASSPGCGCRGASTSGADTLPGGALSLVAALVARVFMGNRRRRPDRARPSRRSRSSPAPSRNGRQ